MKLLRTRKPPIMLSFLNLPQEVRHEIYRLLFHTKRLRPLRHHNRFSPPPLPELGISFTSRIIHHEVTTYILTRCHISLPWPLHIHEPSRWSLKVADLRRIRHLNVDMDLARYIVGNDLAPNLETLTLHVPVWAVPGQFDFPLSGLQERRRWIGKYLAMTVHPSVIDPQRDMRRRLRYLLDRPRAYRVKMRCNLRFEGEKVVSFHLLGFLMACFVTLSCPRICCGNNI